MASRDIIYLDSGTSSDKIEEPRTPEPREVIQLLTSTPLPNNFDSPVVLGSSRPNSSFSLSTSPNFQLTCDNVPQNSLKSSPLGLTPPKHRTDMVLPSSPVFQLSCGEIRENRELREPRESQEPRDSQEDSLFNISSPIVDRSEPEGASEVASNTLDSQLTSGSLPPIEPRELFIPTQSQSDSETVEPAPIVPEEPKNPRKRKGTSEKAPTAKRQKSVKIQTDRKSTAKELIVNLSNDSEEWIQQLRPVLTDCGMTVTCDSHRSHIEAVALIIEAKRRVDTKWDGDQMLFVPCDQTIESTDCTFVVLNYSAFESVIGQPPPAQQAFFDDLHRQLQLTCRAVYLVPGIQKRANRRTNKYNNQIRRRVLSQQPEEEWSPLVEPVSINFAQLTLQVVIDVNVIYPNSNEDCVEWITNLLIDVAYSRYQKKYLDMGIKTGGTWNSVSDCSSEALTRVRGIAPRQSARLISQYGTPGNLISTLTASHSDNIVMGNQCNDSDDSKGHEIYLKCRGNDPAGSSASTEYVEEYAICKRPESCALTHDSLNRLFSPAVSQSLYTLLLSTDPDQVV